MSTHSGRERGLAALSADLVPHGRGIDSAVAGMLDAIVIVTDLAVAPGAQSREHFRMAVEHARATHNDRYSEAFADAAWQAIDELRHAATIGGAS
jgi:hypothetical protein